MMYHTNEFALQRFFQDESARLERRQRSGEFWHRREAELCLAKASVEGPLLRARLLGGTGDVLISLGQRLKGRGEADSPAAV